MSSFPLSRCGERPISRLRPLNYLSQPADAGQVCDTNRPTDGFLLPANLSTANTPRAALFLQEGDDKTTDRLFWPLTLGPDTIKTQYSHAQRLIIKKLQEAFFVVVKHALKTHSEKSYY
jgi:hypothetical protein